MIKIGIRFIKEEGTATLNITKIYSILLLYVDDEVLLKKQF